MDLLSGRTSRAFRALVLALAAPTGTPQEAGVRDALRRAILEEDDAARTARAVLCDWLLQSPAGQSRPRLRLLALESLAQGNPQDLARQWEVIRLLLERKELERFWAVFDRVLSQANDPRHMDARMLLRLARLPAEALLARLPKMQKPGWSKTRVQLLNAAARQVRLSPDRLRRPPLARSGQPYQVTEDGGAGVTAIVFNGLGRNPGAPLAAFDAVLAERGIRAIYLFDDKGTAYITGAAGQISREATYALLQREIDLTPGNHVITIGHSMSAIAAVAYGLDLKVDGVLAFSAATTGRAADREAIGEKRGEDFARMAERLGGDETDLRTWFDRNPHRPKIHLHFAAKKPVDRAQAQRIADYDGVVLHEAAGHSEHALPAEMLLRGTLASAIDGLVKDL